MRNPALLLTLLSISFVLACNLFSGSNTNGSGNTNTAANSNRVATPKPVPADCPASAISVKESSDKQLEKYEGCTLSVRGKLWDVRPDMVELIDANDRAKGSDSIILGGNFSGGKYSEIGLELTGIRFRQQYDRLPIATFTCTVNNVSGYIGLRDCTLTNVEKR